MGIKTGTVLIDIHSEILPAHLLRFLLKASKGIVIEGIQGGFRLTVYWKVEDEIEKSMKMGYD